MSIETVIAGTSVRRARCICGWSRSDHKDNIEDVELRHLGGCMMHMTLWEHIDSQVTEIYRLASEMEDANDSERSELAQALVIVQSKARGGAEILGLLFGLPAKVISKEAAARYAAHAAGEEREVFSAAELRSMYLEHDGVTMKEA